VGSTLVDIADEHKGDQIDSEYGGAKLVSELASDLKLTVPHSVGADGGGGGIGGIGGIGMGIGMGGMGMGGGGMGGMGMGMGVGVGVGGKVHIKIQATPAVRKMAKEHNLDLSLLTALATGPKGRVTKVTPLPPRCLSLSNPVFPSLSLLSLLSLLSYPLIPSHTLS
jgi:hypothetical protein